MAAFRSVFLVVLSFLWTFTRGDTESCVFLKSCVLPCSFVPGEDLVIHWIQLPDNLQVHSFYHSRDQLAYQNSRFKGRTSLFQDQISKGNASLLLSNVQIQDRAKYKCYISTISGSTESFKDLKVEAPVTQIHFEQIGNRINCSSEGIYPEPGLTWSTDPPANMPFENPAIVQQNEQLLYNISSSLILSHAATDVDVSCTISTSNRNSKTATLFKQKSISGSDTQTIECTASTSQDKPSIIWRFNHSQVIVDHSGTVSEEWKSYVKEVTDSGNLVLQLSSSNQDGIYTCELDNSEKKLITNTFLMYKQDSSNVGLVVGLVVLGLIIVGVVVVVVVSLYCVRKKKKNKQGPL